METTVISNFLFDHLVRFQNKTPQNRRSDVPSPHGHGWVVQHPGETFRENRGDGDGAGPRNQNSWVDL